MGGCQGHSGMVFHALQAPWRRTLSGCHSLLFLKKAFLSVLCSAPSYRKRASAIDQEQGSGRSHAEGKAPNGGGGVRGSPWRAAAVTPACGSLEDTRINRSVRRKAPQARLGAASPPAGAPSGTAAAAGLPRQLTPPHLDAQDLPRLLASKLHRARRDRAPAPLPQSGQPQQGAMALPAARSGPEEPRSMRARRGITAGHSSARTVDLVCLNTIVTTAPIHRGKVGPAQSQGAPPLLLLQLPAQLWGLAVCSERPLQVINALPRVPRPPWVASAAAYAAVAAAARVAPLPTTGCAAGMDPQLLALLPDAAKLGILRHLSRGQPAAPPADNGQQQDQPQQTPALLAELPPAVAGRSLQGGLAIVDGFLDEAEVKVRHA